MLLCLSVTTLAYKTTFTVAPWLPTFTFWLTVWVPCLDGGSQDALACAIVIVPLAVRSPGVHISLLPERWQVGGSGTTPLTESGTLNYRGVFLSTIITLKIQ